MTTTERQLTALLRLALTGEAHAVLAEPVDWRAIMKAAIDHAVQGIAFAGIERLPRHRMPPMPVLMDWMGQAEKLKTANGVYHTAVARLAELMDDNRLDYVVFKGDAVAATCYGPMRDLRVSGDVDFYVPSWHFDKAVEAVEQQWDTKVDRCKADKHYAFDANHVRYEMHYQMETFGRRKHQQRFAQLIDDSLRRGDTPHFEANGRQVATLTPELDMMLVLKHWTTHLLGEGVGLRQTTDLAAQIMAYKDRADTTMLRSSLEAIGYRKAFDAAVAIAERYYGVEWSAWGVNDDSRRDADRLMATIMRNGNFGRSDYHFTRGRMKRAETTWRFLRHCLRFLNLAPADIACMVPRRVAISMKAHQ